MTTAPAPDAPRCPGCPAALARSRRQGRTPAACGYCGVVWTERPLAPPVVLQRYAPDPPPPLPPMPDDEPQGGQPRFPTSPLRWKPAAMADMRTLARWSPHASLKSVVLDADRVQVPSSRDHLAGLDRNPRLAELVARIQARLQRPELAGFGAALVERAPRCEACSHPRGTPWRPAPTPQAVDRATRRAALRAKGELAENPGRPASLAAVLRFAHGYHEDSPRPLAEIHQHLAWHFAPSDRRRALRLLKSDALRTSDLFSWGAVLVDAAVHIYERMDHDGDAAALRNKLATLLTPGK